MVLMVGLFEGWNPDDIGTAWCGFSSIQTSNLMRHLRISTYYGCLYFGESPVDEIESGTENQKHYNDPGVIFVEDPFDKSQNPARALSRKCSRSIINAARRALNSLFKTQISRYVHLPGVWMFELIPCCDQMNLVTLKWTVRSRN